MKQFIFLGILTSTLLIHTGRAHGEIPELVIEPVRGTVFNSFNVHIHRQDENRTILIGDSIGSLLFVRHHSGGHSLVEADSGKIIWSLEEDQYDLGQPVGFTVIDETQWLVFYLASTLEEGDVKVALISTENSNISRTFKIPHSDEFSLKGTPAISPDGQWLAAMISSGREHGWMAVSLTDFNRVILIKSRLPLQGYAWASDNAQVVIVQRSGKAMIHDFPDGTLINRVDTQVNNREGGLRWPDHLAFDRDQQELVIFDLLPVGRLRRHNDRISFNRVDTATGEVVRTFKLGQDIEQVRLARDGRAALVYGADTAGKFYLVDTRAQPIPLMCFNTRVQHVSAVWVTDDLDKLFTSESGVPRTANKEDGWPGHECYFELGVEEFLRLRDKGR